MKDLSKPITWPTSGEAQKFAYRRACSLCGGHWVVYPVGDDFGVKCMKCDHFAMSHNHQSITGAHVRARKQSMAKSDLTAEMRKGKPRRSSDEILNELGF